MDANARKEPGLAVKLLLSAANPASKPSSVKLEMNLPTIWIHYQWASCGVSPTVTTWAQPGDRNHTVISVGEMLHERFSNCDQRVL
jgi:hypothetical protein